MGEGGKGKGAGRVVEIGRAPLPRLLYRGLGVCVCGGGPSRFWPQDTNLPVVST